MKTKLSKRDILTNIKNIALVVIGTLILSFGTSLFLLPYDLVVGGVSGYGIILARIIPPEILSVELIITILTWVLFFIGLIVLGRSFALKTLISTIVYPIGLMLFSNLTSPDFLGGFFNLAGETFTKADAIVASVFSGVLIGLGCALSFVGGGSTGGIDVISLIICKIFKKWRMSIVVFCIDASAIVLGMFVIGNFYMTLLGIVSAFVSAITLDKVLLGGSKAFVAHIITDKYDEINRQVIERLGRTTTIVDVTGGYSGRSKKMLIVSFSVKQYSELMSIVTKTDRVAFMTVNQAHEIYGEDWTF